MEFKLRDLDVSCDANPETPIFSTGFATPPVHADLGALAWLLHGLVGTRVGFFGNRNVRKMEPDPQLPHVVGAKTWPLRSATSINGVPFLLHSEGSANRAVLIHENEFLSSDLLRIYWRLCMNRNRCDVTGSEAADEASGKSQRDSEFGAHKTKCIGSMPETSSP